VGSALKQIQNMPFLLRAIDVEINKIKAKNNPNLIAGFNAKGCLNSIFLAFYFISFSIEKISNNKWGRP